jgi:hypothetical protein
MLHTSGGNQYRKQPVFSVNAVFPLERNSSFLWIFLSFFAYTNNFPLKAHYRPNTFKRASELPAIRPIAAS